MNDFRLDNEKKFSAVDIQEAAKKVAALIDHRLGEHGEAVSPEIDDALKKEFKPSEHLVSALHEGVGMLVTELENRYQGIDWSLEEFDGEEYPETKLDYEEIAETIEHGLCRQCGGITLAAEGWRCAGTICLRCGRSEGDFID